MSTAYSSKPAALPPLDCLLAALAVARSGSFSAAALELEVTHAAISRRVAGAETWAGLSLFVRHARGASPTAEGERLLSRVAQGLEAIDRAADRGRKVRRTATLKLATTPSFARWWLLPRLAALEAALGGARIEVLADFRLVDLRHEEIDAAVRYGPGQWKGLHAEALFGNETLTPVLSRALVGDGRLSARTIGSLPLLHNGDSALWRAWCDAMGLEFRGKPADRTLADSVLALAAAQAGLGVALAQDPLHCGTIGDSLVVARRFVAPSPLNWYVVRRDAESAPSLVQALLAAARRAPKARLEAAGATRGAGRGGPARR